MNDILNKVIDITVAIPTYNGAERLPTLLERLLAQTGIENLTWEIIIVDNNSSDSTETVINSYQKVCHSVCPLRYFLETKQGAAFARIRAVNEAKGELIAFLDDDNLPEPDWLISAYTFGIEHPQAGAWSGQIHGSYEVSPPKNFERIQGFLAIRELGNQPHLFEAEHLRLPPGAALVVRKQVWCDNVPQELVLKGRLGKSMVGGEDLEPLLYLHKAGWEIWYNPNMHTYHQIPHWRLEKDYLLSLARGCGLCIFHLRLIKTKNWQKPIIFIRTFLGNLYRIIKHIIKYKSTLRNDIVALVEVEFYLGSMMSPFYYVCHFF